MVLGHPIPGRGGSMRRDAVIGTVLAGWLSFGATSAIGQGLTPVLNANTKVTGVPRPNVLSVELAEVIRRSEEHTSELQSQSNLVCRLLLEKKKKKRTR